MKSGLTSRRQTLKAMGLFAGALALESACAHRGGVYVVEPPIARGRPLRRFARVKVSEERIIRTVVGLRPFRPSGFVVRAEPLGEKWLVHNYGHGGGGVTLSWGTAHLAAELVSQRATSGRVAVVGCGVVGLSTARLLQRRGFEVTIYARDLPPNTTSNIAGASWHPTAVVAEASRTPAFDAQFERAARFSHRYFQGLIGEDYSVRWREQYTLSEQPLKEASLDVLLHDLYPEPRQLQPGEHPFPAPHVFVENTMFIEPRAYLDALTRDFFVAGGHIVVRAFDEPQQLAQLSEPIIVNCTGLGARKLFGDQELTPLKGQLTVLLPQPEVDYALTTSGGLYMFPRRDGIMLGGTRESGVETLEPNPEAARNILAGHRKIFESMR